MMLWFVVLLMAPISAMTLNETLQCELKDTKLEPHNVAVLDNRTGIFISWDRPAKGDEEYYSVQYREESPWKTLSEDRILPNETIFFVGNLTWARRYGVRVIAHYVDGCSASEEVRFTVRLSAIIGIVVAGLLFLLVVALVTVYIVKLCQRRKRHALHKANYNSTRD